MFSDQSSFWTYSKNLWHFLVVLCFAKFDLQLTSKPEISHKHRLSCLLLAIFLNMLFVVWFSVVSVILFIHWGFASFSIEEIALSPSSDEQKEEEEEESASQSNKFLFPRLLQIKSKVSVASGISTPLTRCLLKKSYHQNHVLGHEPQ